MKKKKISTIWGNTSLTTGIIGLVLFLAPYIGIFLSIFAVVSASQQNKIESTGNSNAGRVLGIIGIVINSIILLIISVALIIGSVWF